jgi:hypothetical protein
MTLIVSKWQPFRFIFSQGNRKVGCGGDKSHAVFDKKKFSSEKRSVKRPVFAKVRGEVFSHFHPVAVKRFLNMRN